MPHPSRVASLLPLVLPLFCAGAGLAACGGAGDHTSATSTGTGTGSGGQGGAGSTTGAGAGTGTGMGGNIGLGGGPQKQTFTVSPAKATITIGSRNAPATQPFTARLDGAPVAQVVWTLDSYTEGDITAAGDYATTGLVGGTVQVTATFGKQTAKATLEVKVDLSEDVIADPMDPGPAPVNKTALLAAPLPDPGAAAMPPNPTKILYPYDRTVMPRGLTAPLVQWSPGSLPPEDAEVRLTATHFTYHGYFHVKDPTTPQFDVPQDIWDAALQSSGGEKLAIDVIKAAAGKAYGPATSSILVAPGSLKGAVYYMTYAAPQNGLYSVKPGVRQPANLLIPGCVVCHSVSANGSRLAAGADADPYIVQSGIYDVNSNGTDAQVTGSPPGLGGDSRGISYATFTPDGQYVMRSQSNFWGGVNQLAWKIDDANKLLVPANVAGLGAGVSALVPAISPDGKRYAFTNGPGEPQPFGTVSRSVSLMDLAIDAASSTLTFSNRTLLVDNGPGGSVTKFVNFLPDPRFIVLQEGEGYQAAYDEMLPTWGPDSNYDTSTGRLYMIKTGTKEHVELATLNAGNVAIDRQRNYEPFSLQVTAGGYFWVVFTSIREYGNTYTGPNVRKQLWVAAINTASGPGDDPSHPPFHLPNQSATPNERGYWALEPCKKDGSSCDTGDECCGGFCRPSVAGDPKSPKVCKPPMVGSCSQSGEKCTMDGDCCDAAAGTRCIGGYCTQKGPA